MPKKLRHRTQAIFSCILLLLFLAGCQAMVDSLYSGADFQTGKAVYSKIEKKYVGKEIYSAGEGICIRQEKYISQTQYIAYRCPKDLEVRYTIIEASSFSTNNLHDKRVAQAVAYNLNTPTVYYLLIHTDSPSNSAPHDMNIVITENDLISEKMPDGFVDEHGIAIAKRMAEAERNKIEAEKQLAQRQEIEHRQQEKLVEEKRLSKIKALKNIPPKNIIAPYCTYVSNTSYDRAYCVDAFTNYINKISMLPPCEADEIFLLAYMSNGYAVPEVQNRILGQKNGGELFLGELFNLGAGANCAVTKKTLEFLGSQTIEK